MRESDLERDIEERRAQADEDDHRAAPPLPVASGQAPKKLNTSIEGDGPAPSQGEGVIRNEKATQRSAATARGVRNPDAGSVGGCAEGDPRGPSLICEQCGQPPADHDGGWECPDGGCASWHRRNPPAPPLPAVDGQQHAKHWLAIGPLARGWSAESLFAHVHEGRQVVRDLIRENVRLRAKLEEMLPKMEEFAKMGERHAAAYSERQSRVEELERELRKVEWSWGDYDCPVCAASQRDGHEYDCSLGSALDAAPAADRTPKEEA